MERSFWYAVNPIVIHGVVAVILSLHLNKRNLL
jgi:hypothetical protein